MAAAFILMMLFYKEDEKEEVKEGKEMKDVKGVTSQEIVIASPLSGSVVKLEDVEDAAFSSGALGKGAAIMPSEGVVYAPADGVITAMFPTGHAIGMMTDSGVEVLIHVGMDTVQMEGRGFYPMIQPGERVVKGQKLLEFDMDLIREAGFSLVTPVLITNFMQYEEVAASEKAAVKNGDRFLTVS